ERKLRKESCDDCVDRSRSRSRGTAARALGVRASPGAALASDGLSGLRRGGPRGRGERGPVLLLEGERGILIRDVREEQDGHALTAQVGERRGAERNPGTTVRIRALAVERDLRVAFATVHPVTDVVDLLTIHAGQDSQNGRRKEAATVHDPRAGSVPYSLDRGRASRCREPQPTKLLPRPRC